MAKTALAHVGDGPQDRAPQKIGKITDVIHDDRTLDPRWCVVKVGLLKGHHLVPVGSVRRSGDEVVVPFDKKLVQSAPNRRDPFRPRRSKRRSWPTTASGSRRARLVHKGRSTGLRRRMPFGALRRLRPVCSRGFCCGPRTDSSARLARLGVPGRPKRPAIAPRRDSRAETAGQVASDHPGPRRGPQRGPHRGPQRGPHPLTQPQTVTLPAPGWSWWWYPKSPKRM
jgi:hypothetical protein